MFKWVSIILAGIGVAVGVWTVSASRRCAPQIAPDRPPATNPYAHGLAASGTVEAASRNIRIASPEPGLVTQVFVDVGDRVKAGESLFQLDPRTLESELARSRAAVEVAASQLLRLQSMPRKEDLGPLQAALQRAQAQLANAQNERDSLRQMHNRQAATDTELRRAELAVEESIAQRAGAQAELDRVLAGAWKSDLAVATANLDQAKAEVASIQSRLDRLTVRSPVDGTVLKRLVEPGEYSSPAEGPAMQMGDISTLHIRAQVDESAIRRCSIQALSAVAVLIGKERISYELSMLRIEPLAIPKRNLTGVNTELVDTRVVEVLFKVKEQGKGEGPLYPGQMVDVYIEAEPNQTSVGR